MATERDKPETQLDKHKKNRSKLTTKYCESLKDEGEYLDYGGPVKGLCFNVTASSTKSWLQRYGFKGKRREMGHGSFPEVGLAEAREKGGDARKLLGRKIDPLEHRKEQRQQQRAAEAASKTFKEIGDQWLASNQLGAKDTRWRDSSVKSIKGHLNNHFKLLHNMYPRDIDELFVFEKILKPLMETAPSTVDYARWIGEQIIKLARGPYKCFPLDRLNPFSKEALKPLMGTWEHKSTPLPALHFDKFPAFMATLVKKRTRDYYTVNEYARVVNRCADLIYDAIYTGRLKATKVEQKFPTTVSHWRIPEATAFAPIGPYAKVTDVVRPTESVGFFIIEFAALTGTRPAETRMMRKSEYDPETGIWTLPWQRHKVGRKTRRDHVMPLAPEAIEIINLVNKQHHRDGINPDYQFGHFADCRTLATPGDAPTAEHVRKCFKRALFETFGEAEKDKVMHADRTTLRSWGQAQRRYGLRLYEDDVLERAINHIGGYGKTEVVRIYNRDTPFVAEMIPLYSHWARYCYTKPDPTKILPFRRQAKQSEGGERNARIQRQQNGN
jgi:integrase